MLPLPFEVFPVLHTERCTLRGLREDDAEALFAMRSDPEVMRLISRPLQTRREEAEALIAQMISSMAAGDSLQWVIHLKDEDQLIGLIGFWRMQKEHFKAELGYMLAREHWGKGLVSEAIASVVPFAFEKLGLHRVEAITAPENFGSARVLEKNGFVREGHFRENHFWQGHFYDSLHFGRVAE